MKKDTKKIIDKSLIDLQISKTQLAKELNVSRVFLTSVINGKRKSETLLNRIFEYISDHKNKK